MELQKTKEKIQTKGGKPKTLIPPIRFPSP